MQEENQAGRPATDSGEKIPPENYVFALDIGTRSVIGIVGVPRGERLEVCAIEIAEHEKRAMIDGQIEDIEQVSRVAGLVKKRLEVRVGYPLNRVCVAAAGRALRTCEVHFELDLQTPQVITPEILCRLEAGAVQQAEHEFSPPTEEESRSLFYLVGYSVSRYLLDNYPLASLLDHRGQQLSADVIATFLPREVVDSLYSAMQKCGLEVSSLTLEPIAAMNAAIPQSLRLLNLALVDIGAGTSDIAVSRDGGVVGYTMATIAGDEVTEALMREYLVDFPTAEKIKLRLGQDDDISFQDILGLEQQVSPAELKEKLTPVLRRLAEEITQQILAANGEAPSAVFLVGGGSKLPGLCACVAELLGLPTARVALGGRNFSAYLTKADPSLTTPEFATPLGIAVSSALNLINDSFTILLNGTRAKLFRSNSLSVLDVLLMNGWRHDQMIGRSGKSLVFELDGENKMIYGDHPTLAKIQLNGQDASLSDTVKAGDTIIFEPAQGGRDATLTLGEMIDLHSPGTVFLGSEEISLGLRAAVNGQPGTPEQTIHTRDRIRTRPVSTLEQLLSFAGMPEGTLFLVNGDAVPPHTLLHPGDRLEPLNWEKSETPSPESWPDRPQTDALPAAPIQPLTPTSQPDLVDLLELEARNSAQKKSLGLQAQNAAGLLPAFQKESPGRTTEDSVPPQAQEQMPQPPIEPTPPILVILNGRPVRLEGKTDRSPYCLIDTLNLVDVDLTTPQGAIVLRINGHESGYLEPLKNGDEVEIYWDGQTNRL
ncbi:cell division protein FtsA [Faecalispora anaeroviscerum]|uniref:cell division protein FtsA n=1 Tax=Faecalispora anaeroviscerum TaxID=2991836 RepID=UPI0024BB9702|nr:cell division protein FtsA [Faecalispora anaeroviscerum]